MYSASKAAAEMLMKHAAIEVNWKGIFAFGIFFNRTRFELAFYRCK